MNTKTTETCFLLYRRKANRRSKTKTSCNNYFETYWNNIKNTWKGIKSLISIKTVASSAPTVLLRDNGNTITNPYDTANTFNNYFASIAETTKINIKYSHKHFPDYLKEEFLKPTIKEEIGNIVFSRNSNKGSGSNFISS